MKSDFSSYWFTPESFHQRAEQFSEWRWRLLMWSALCFTLYLLLSSQVSTKTPDALVWLTLFILFSALQALVLGSFVFSFENCHQHKLTVVSGLLFIAVLNGAKPCSLPFCYRCQL